MFNAVIMFRLVTSMLIPCVFYLVFSTLCFSVQMLYFIEKNHNFSTSSLVLYHNTGVLIKTFTIR